MSVCSNEKTTKNTATGERHTRGGRPPTATGGTGNKATAESTQKREQTTKCTGAIRMHTEGRRRPTTTESNGNKARGDIAKKRARRPQGAITSSEKEEKKEAHQRNRITTRINAAAALTEIRGMYMGGAHHDVGSLSRKRYTQYVGQQPKGHWGNSENTGGDPHGRRQGRECVCTNGAAGRQTQLEELKNTNTRGARQLESRLDLHARGTKGGHRRAFSGIWLRGLSPAGKVLTGCSACG